MDFIADIFELFGIAFLGDFSTYMERAGVYSSIFYIMIFLPLIVAFVYYILLDHILLAQRRKWLLTGIGTSIASGLISLIISRISITDYLFRINIQTASIGIGDYISFAFIVMFYSALLFLMFSCLFKSFSSRCRNIPF